MGYGIITTAVILFIMIWGVWGWQETVLFDNTWRFDALGHAIAGFGGALMLLHLIKTYALDGMFRIRGKFLLAFTIVAIVTTLQTIIWEGLESYWDYYLQPIFFSHLAQAQKGGMDTTIDNLTTMGAAIAAMIAWNIYDRFMRSREEIEQKEINEVNDLIEELSEKIRVRRREHLRKLRPSFKKLWRLIKTRIKRPSKEEKPDEPYSDRDHTPGVTHNKHDTIADTFKALEKREFGGVAMSSVDFVGIAEAQDPPRGPYLLLIHAATIDATPVNPRGRWVAIKDIPWEDLVTSHREKIIPTALKWWKRHVMV